MAQVRAVRDLMVPISEYPIVKESESFNHCLMVLRDCLKSDKSHRSLLVQRGISLHKDRVTVITVRNIMRAIKEITRSYDFDELSRIAHSMEDYDVKSRFYKQRLLTRGFLMSVGELMRDAPRVSVAADVTPSVATRLMLVKNLDAIPVHDEADEVIGVIRSIDVLQYTAELLQ